MKNRATVLCFFVACFNFFSCSDDKNEPGVLEMLSASTWTVQTVAVDGVDNTSMFQAMTLKFTESQTFTTTNGGVVWPATGTFSLSDNEIIRDDDVVITIETINENELVLLMQWEHDTLGSGRTASISGEHIFTFRS